MVRMEMLSVIFGLAIMLCAVLSLFIGREETAGMIGRSFRSVLVRFGIPSGLGNMIALSQYSIVMLRADGSFAMLVLLAVVLPLSPPKRRKEELSFFFFVIDRIRYENVGNVRR